MSWLSNMFGSGTNPANAANQTLGQIPGAVNPYYQPYIDRGQQSGNALSDQYSQLINDPGALYSQLGSGYKQSPGYQFKLQQALGAAQRANQAGGMLGTPQDQQQQAGVANDIASQDYEEYINHILSMYGLGTQGRQKEEEQGYNASTGYGDILGSVLGQQAQNQYAGQAADNARRAQNWSNLFKAGGAGVGYAAGGPFGGLIGGGFGSNMFGGS